MTWNRDVKEGSVVLAQNVTGGVLMSTLDRFHTFTFPFKYSTKCVYFKQDKYCISWG